MKNIDQAKADLLIILPYLKYAINEAEKKGKSKLGIICEFEDGGGRIEAKFDISFLEDVALVISAPEQTDDDNLKAIMRQFMDRHGLS